MNILFTCAGRRNYLINYFKKALNGSGKVFASDMQLTAPALIDADEAIVVPSIYDKKYIETLLDIVKVNDINAIISLNDLELPILAVHKHEFLNIGVRVLVSDKEVINTAFDKLETVKFLEKNNLKTPKTFISLDNAKKALNHGELSFPVVVKPRWGSASIAVDFASNLEELELVYKIQSMKLKNSILSTASKDAVNSAILIQQKINGKEFGIDILNDFNGNYYATFAREKLSMRSGETDKAVSVIDDKLSQIGNIIGKKLSHIGNLDCDVFYDGKDYFVLELNPRFGGGYPFSHEAGIDTPSIYVEWLNNSNNIERYNNYKHGVAFAKCDRLLDITKGYSG